mmetsp:Transcript_21274/g.18432  ORF Transcript_21274/g.18432 Transcript_21274/m.18432 type:complete len:87 (+) Transcript_21274:67-327(+)
MHVEFVSVGADKFSEKIRQKNYHEANLIILCLDCSKPYDSDMIERWMKEILLFLGNAKTKVLLFGTKYDLAEKGDDSVVKYGVEAT